MNRQEPSYAPGRIVGELTQGKPYVFVVMTYLSKWPLFERIERVVWEAVGLRSARSGV